MDTEELEYDDIDQEEDVVEATEDFLDSDKEEKESEPEEEEYGKRVQKRINQEVSKRKQLESDNKALADRLANLEHTFYAKASEEQNKSLDTRMTELKAKRKEMYELGDIDPDLEDEWQDLRLEQRERSRQQKTPQQQQQPDIPRAQQSWLDDNSDWYGVDEAKTKQANEKFQEMLDAGFDANHHGAYLELSKRVNTPTTRRESAPPPAGPSGSSGKPVSKAKLTQVDFEMMSEMGLDPRNAEHRKQLLSNRSA